MGAYSRVGRLFGRWVLIRAGRLLDIPVSRGAYSRGLLFEGALDQSITVFVIIIVIRLDILLALHTFQFKSKLKVVISKKVYLG